MKKLVKTILLSAIVSSSLLGASVQISVNYPKTFLNISVQNALEKRIEKCSLYDDGDTLLADGLTNINLNLSKGSYNLRLECNGTTKNGLSNTLFGSQLTEVTVETGLQTNAQFDLYPTAFKTVEYTIDSEDIISNGEYKFIFRDGTTVTKTLIDKSITFDIEDHNPLTEINSMSDVKIGNIVYTEQYLYTLYAENAFTITLADIPINLSAGVNDDTKLIYTTGITEDKPEGEIEPKNLFVQAGDYTFSAKKIDGTTVNATGFLTMDGVTINISNNTEFNIDSNVENLTMNLEYPEGTLDDVVIKFEGVVIPSY